MRGALANPGGELTLAQAGPPASFHEQPANGGIFV